MTDPDRHETANTDGDTENPRRWGTTTNAVKTNEVSGLVVQGGTITGGIHQHLPERRPPAPTPHQLPSAPAGFVGRADQLVALDRALAAPGPSADNDAPRGRRPAVIAAIGGTGGIGKTWLAVTWANRNIEHFPDGQLTVDLRGFGPGKPRPPTDVLADFLTALGADRDHQPTDLDACIALYRTHTTGKRLLILLDNAATTDQVEPLLPGGNTCTVMITSRHRLPALAARHGARQVRLDVLTDTEASTLLRTALADTHIAAGADRAITELIGQCQGFPLALGLIAARIRNNPSLLHDFVADLRDLGLDALDSNDPAASLPTVLSWSLRHLTEQQRTLFGLLGIAPGPGTTLPAVASLIGLPQTGARRVLWALEEASLLERRPGGRYVMHDLVRDYAASTILPADVREAALTRVMDFYLHTAHTAASLLYPHRPLLHPAPPAPGVHLLLLADAATATAWLEAEHATLLATQRVAMDLAHHQVAWHLAWTLDSFHLRRGHRRDALASWRVALDAAVYLPNPAALSRAHRLLGQSCSRLGLHQEATVQLDLALDLAVRHHDSEEQARTHQVLAFAWGRRGDDQRALDHAQYSLNLYRALNHSAPEADALNAAAWFAARVGKFDTARDHCREALALHRYHHDLGGEAATLDSLGFIAHRTGNHRQAVDHYHQALTLYRRVGYTYEIANTLDNIGHPHGALGQHDRACAVWRAALEMYQEQGRTVDAERTRRQLDELNSASAARDGLENRRSGQCRARKRHEFETDHR